MSWALAGVLLVCLALSPVSALYSPGGPVTVLTTSNFKSKVKSGGVWLVEFYAPWCGHCRNLQPDWEKAASALKGIVNVAAVDADQEKQLGGEYGVQGFPTIKFFYVDDSGNIKSSDYNSGARTAKDLITFALDKAKAYALKRIGASGGSKSGNGGSKGSAGGAGGGCGAGGGPGGHAGGGGEGLYGSDSDVVILSDDDFQDNVIDSESLWFVEFYAPWCGHCKNLKPSWEEAATSLKGKVKVGAVDCTTHQQTCSKFGVNGYPTIKFFGSNKRRPEDYQGGRTGDAITEYALQKWAQLAPPPEVRELVSPEIFERECLGAEGHQAKRFCFLAFLPDIIDSQAAGRNGYINILKQVAEAFKDKAYSYFWVQGGQQEALEKSLNVGGFGYPALVAYYPKGNIYATSKSAFETAHIKEFVTGLSNTRQFVTLTQSLPEVATIAPWDGKDAQVQIEDEFSLEDIMGGDEPSGKSEL